MERGWILKLGTENIRILGIDEYFYKTEDYLSRYGVSGAFRMQGAVKPPALQYSSMLVEVGYLIRNY